MMNWKTVLVLVGAVGIGVAVVFVITGTGGSVHVSPGEVVVATSKVLEAEKRTSAKPIRPKRTSKAVSRPVMPREPPKFEIGSDEEAKLTVAQAKLLAEIRDALKAENKKEIIRLIRRLQAMDEWPDGIPMAVKKASLEALGWCGASALPELLGFLGDADKSIVAQASSYWEDAIAECDHDIDKTVDGVLQEGLATHVKNAAKVINDVETMESVLDEITSGMRHSVAVETIKDILENGNDLAKEKITSVIEDLTDDETIRTAEQLDEWLKNNPDDADDKYMYGGEDDTTDD